MMRKHLELLKIQKMDLKSHQLNITKDLIEEYLSINNKKKFCLDKLSTSIIIY